MGVTFYDETTCALLISTPFDNLRWDSKVWYIPLVQCKVVFDSFLLTRNMQTHSVDMTVRVVFRMTLFVKIESIEEWIKETNSK